MINSKYLYPEAIQQESIDIPRDIHIYFKTRPLQFYGAKEPARIHVPLPREGSKKSVLAVTYGNAEGNNPINVPREYFNDPKLMNDFEEYPLQNLSNEDQKIAETVAIAAIRKLKGPGRYSIRRREYMINTSTMPIRVYFEEEGKKERNPIYIKRPDLTRLMGKWLYDIISGHPRRAYAFNRAVFIEEAVPGSVLSKLDERELLKNRDYREGVVRASVHASFLDIPDINNKRNRIVSENFSTLLFDFNIMLMGIGRNLEGKVILNPLLDRYQELHGNKYHWFLPPYVNDVLVDEKRKVAERVKAEEDRFFDMIRLMEDVADMTQMTYRYKARVKYDSESLEDFFRKKVLEYSKAR